MVALMHMTGPNLFWCEIRPEGPSVARWHRHRCGAEVGRLSTEEPLAGRPGVS